MANKQVQKKIDLIKELVERQYESPEEYGEMHDYLRCIDTANDIWEVAFVIHFNDDLFATLESSSANSRLSFKTTYGSLEYQGCLIPMVFARINDNEKLSFVSLLRPDIFKEKGHPMADVNLLQILNEQQKLYIDLVVNGKKMQGVYLTNAMKGYLAQDVAKLDRVKFDSKTSSDYFIARGNIKFQAEMANRLGNATIGEIFWKKFVK